MKGNRNIIIAKIDFTANDVDLVGATITGFPTVLLYKQGAKQAPVVYTGKRDLASLVAFVEMHQEQRSGQLFSEIHNGAREFREHSEL